MTSKTDKRRVHEMRLAEQGYRYRKFKVHDDDYVTVKTIIDNLNAKHRGDKK